MKLISKEAAIAAITIIPDEVKPLNGWNIPELLRTITERYEFAKSPSVQETQATGAKFQNGRLVAKNINIAELNVFNNGIGAKTTDTNDSEVVIKDLYRFLKKRFDFREPSTKPVRVFQSELIVEFKNNPDHTLKAFGPLISLLQREAEAISGIKKQIQLNRIDFASDAIVPGPNVVFLIERRAGVPYASNRYFCRAYMPTDAHIRALELLDKLLAVKS